MQNLTFISSVPLPVAASFSFTNQRSFQVKRATKVKLSSLRATASIPSIDNDRILEPGKPLKINKPLDLLALAAAQARKQNEELEKVKDYRTVMKCDPQLSKKIKSDDVDQSRILFGQYVVTPGGWIYHVDYETSKKSTRHTIILGVGAMEKISPEGSQIPSPESMIRYIFQYLVDKKTDLQNTVGMLEPDRFSVNYFSLTQLLTFYPESANTFNKWISDQKQIDL